MNATSYDVVALGETMLSLVSVREPLAKARTLLVTHGGAESNTCVGLARLGLRTAWLSRLGDDPPGERIRSALEREGIDLQWARIDPERPTGLMLRETTGAAPRYYRAGSAASCLAPEDLAGAPVEAARAVLVTAITALIGEGPQRAAIALLERARGLRVVDSNLRPGLWGSSRAAELALPLVERSDLLLAGEAELRVLFGDLPPDELAAACRDRGCREVVLKRGNAGAAVFDESGDRHDHAPMPGPDVDPVGAGDAFNAGYLAARLAGRSAVEALRDGAKCGAAVAGVVGDTEGFPRRAPARVRELDEQEVTDAS